MSSPTLSSIEARVAAMLFDSTQAVFTLATIDEAIRSALADLNAAAPQPMETVIELPADGREIALDGIANLLYVVDVWFPYDPLLLNDWPAQRPCGYRVWWDDGRPVLLITDDGGQVPKAGQSARIWYQTPHTLNGLDGEIFSSIGVREALVVRGAAGCACLSRSVDLNESSTTSGISTPNYGTLAEYYLQQSIFGFYAQLERMRREARVAADLIPATCTSN